MKHYYSLDGKLYYLTDSKQKKYKELFPEFGMKDNERDERHNLEFTWLEKNGKLIGTCDCLVYL